MIQRISLRDYFRKTLRSSRKNWVKWLLSILAFGGSISVLGWLVYRQKELLLNFEWHLRPIHLLFSFLFYCLTLLIVVLVWSKMLKALGHPMGFFKNFRYYCISNLAKRLPGTVWYVVLRTQLYQQEGVPLSLTSIVSGLELAVSIISGVIAITIFGVQILNKYQVGLWGILILFIISLVLIHPQVAKKIIKKFTKQEHILNYRDIFVWVILYTVSWITGGGIVFEIINFIYPLPFADLGYIVGSWILVSVLATTLFFFPTNMGLSELGLSFLYSTLMPSSIGVVVAIVSRIFMMVYEIFWAFAGFALESWDNRNRNK